MLFALPVSALPESTSGFVQFLTLIVIFIFVVGITLIATRWIANYQKGISHAANIEVVETCRLTTNKYVQIIRVGEKYMAIAIGRDEVNFLTEISADELKDTAVNMNPMPEFTKVLAKFKKAYSNESNEDKD